VISQYFPIYTETAVLNIEVLSHIGVIYYAFISGLEMDLNSILHVKKKDAIIAISGIIFPMVMGPVLYILHRKFYGNGDGSKLEESTMDVYVQWTLVLTMTSFSIVAHTLSELKLLNTGLGQTALTTSMISDTYSWVLYTITLPFSINGIGAIYSVLSTVVFVFICIYVVRPIIVKVIDRKLERDEWDDKHLLFLVMGIFVCSYITGILGTQDIVGAFVFGLILPHGKFADMVTSMTDDFGGVFLASLFFSRNGMRFVLKAVFLYPSWPLTLVIIILLCVPKILSTLFTTFFFGMRTQDSFALGMILNTKGALALIMLNTIWDRHVLIYYYLLYLIFNYHNSKLYQFKF